MTADEPETFVPASPTKLTAWDLLGIDPDHPGVAKHTDADLAAAEARGYRKAIEALRAGQPWDSALRIAADYLEANTGGTDD